MMKRVSVIAMLISVARRRLVSAAANLAAASK